MQLGLCTFFDLGETVGLSDDVFSDDSLAPLFDISDIGLANPLGRGIAIDLLAEEGLLRRWRDEAAEQLSRPQLEVGWNETTGVSKEDFVSTLRDFVRVHLAESCRLTAYAVGAVFVELLFRKGVPKRFIEGFFSAYEFAAYQPSISKGLRDIALERVREAREEHAAGLVNLTQRRPPSASVDQSGYEESDLLTKVGFTRLIVCLGATDAEGLASLVEDAGPFAAPIDFEYHGRLYYSWSTTLLVARSALHPGDEFSETAHQQLGRMLACVQIAHVFHAACVAFSDLFIDEVRQQVGGYITETSAGRSAEDLNRLRTLALAVVSLTNFQSVTATDEDRSYFQLYESNAHLARLHAQIQESCEVVYNVQVAATQLTSTRRQDLLNAILLLLTSLTLISVSVDAYDFLRDQEPIIRDRPIRAVILLVELALIATILAVFFRLFRSRSRASHAGHR